MKSNVLSNDPAEDIAPISPFGKIDYGTTEEDLKKLAAQSAGITQVTSRKEFDAAQAAVTTLVRARSRIETRRKELKAESLEFGRLVDSTAKSLIAVVTPEEQRIDALLEAVKAQKAAEKAERERIEKARIDAILARIDGILKVPAAHQRSKSADVAAAKAALEVLLIDETFQEFQDRAQEAKTNAIAELTELHAGALHDERIEAQERAERERVAAEQKAEAARLAKEREELEAVRARQAAEQAERDRIERERIDAERAEIARQQAELDAQRKKIEDEKRAEQERIESQQRAEAAAAAKAEAEAREARMRPDREKLIAFAQLINSIEPPELSEEWSAVRDDVKGLLAKTASRILDIAAGH